MFIVSMAGATCAAALLTLGRVVGFKRIIKNATLVDVAFSVGVVAVLGATVTGALTAVLAGLFMAITLSVGKSVMAAVDAIKGLWPSFSAAVQDHYPKQPAATSGVDVCSAPTVPDVPAPRPANTYRGKPVVIYMGDSPNDQL